MLSVLTTQITIHLHLTVNTAHLLHPFSLIETAADLHSPFVSCQLIDILIFTVYTLDASGCL